MLQSRSYSLNAFVFVLTLAFSAIAFAESPPLMVLGAVPLALIGGIVSLLVTGTNFSISAAVGFISLLGVAVLDVLVLIACIKTLQEQGSTLHDAVFVGSQLRLRPVLMTALAAAIGLSPAAVATGMGSQTHSRWRAWLLAE